MYKSFFKKMGFAKQIVFLSIFLVPTFSLFAAQASSTNFILNDFLSGTGGSMSSTNFSLTGAVSQSSTGFWSTNSVPLAPGTITSCGKITASGTYTLTTNLIGISGPCFIVLANNVTINGGGYTVTAGAGNTNYAVMATSSVADGGSGYSTTTIQNITFSGFGGGVNASGSNNPSSAGGNGGSVFVASSTMGSIFSSGGSGSNAGNGGNGGSVTVATSTVGSITTTGLTNGSAFISGSNLNLSNNTYTTDSLNLNYSGTLTTSTTTLSALTHLIINSVDLGTYIGGAFPIIPGSINTCGTLYFAGSYTLGGNVSGSCNIAHSNVTLAGAGHTLTGNVTANNYGATLSNITVTGAVSTTGATPGALTVVSSSNLTGTINVTGIINGDGSSSLGNTTINSGASVATSSVSFTGNVINNGTINSFNAVAGKTTNNFIINGDFIFNASSTNTGTVNGNAILSASSTNTGTIKGNATFNSLTSVSGIISFGGTTAFAGIGIVNGNIYDSTSTQITSWVFSNSSSNAGIINGDATFNNTSSNTITGTVKGNATFDDTSTNLGIVTLNAYVNSPVVRPIGNRSGIAGSVIYYGYPGLYFNNASSTNWSDLGNWWTDINFTQHSPVLPTVGDDVIIYGNITTGGPTAVKSIIFQTTSTNNITITASSTSRDGALFNASSTNGVSGVIIGNATFFGPGTDNLGTVSGYITRQYGSSLVVAGTILHNFTYLTVQALSNAVVDLSTNVTYNLTNYYFQALNNASFIWNTLTGAGVGAPNLVINSTVTEANAKWSPNISWGTSNLVQYKTDEIGGGVYVSANSSLNGSDIPRPTSSTSTPHTYFFKSTDSHGNVTEKSATFIYNNTLAVSTDCTQPLDEVTRPYYYLTSNVGNCLITASTTLRGDDNGGGHFYTVGNITGSSTSINLTNITATGTVSSFTNITVASSTLSGNIIVNGIFNSDSQSRLGNTTNNGTINSGTFVGTLTNNGTTTNSTSTPVTVALSTTNNGNITGGFVFNGASINNGTTTGTTTLNGTSANQNIIVGNTILNGSSTNFGTVNGDLIFNTFLSINGAVTFSGGTNFLGTGHANGNIRDYQGNLITRWVFTDTSANTGFLKGVTFFNGSSTNIGTVYGDAYFSDASTNSGTVIGNIYTYSYVITPFTGTLVYHSYPNAPSFNNVMGDNDWNNLNNWFTDTTLSLPLGRTPNSGDTNLVLFASTTLPSDITSNIFIAVSSTTLDGAGHTLNGKISGNGAYGGNNAYDFNIQNITVTGTTSATGGDGITHVIDGGKGGNINVATSSTWAIAVNGGDPTDQNGGDAGTINVFNSYATQENTPLLAVGGDSHGCGYGGSGGNISLVDSSGYKLVTDVGADSTLNCAPGPAPHRSTGYVSVVGTYISPAQRAAALAAKNAPAPHSSSVSATYVPYNPLSQGLVLPVNQLKPLNLKPLPTFGEGKGSFSFIAPITGFLFAPSLITPPASLKAFLDLNKISSAQSYASINIKPLPLITPYPDGLFTIKNIKTNIKSFISSDSKNKLIQLIKVSPQMILTISLKGETTGKWNGQTVTFRDDSVVITVPKKAGRYYLVTPTSVIPLAIDVIANKEITTPVIPAPVSTNPIINIFIKITDWFSSWFK